MTNINTRDKYGRTPLIWAAINNSEYTAKRLLEAGADIDAQDKEGWTALMFASWNNYYSLAKMLIDFDANMELKNNRGRTALECAAWNKATQTADLLIMNSVNSEDAKSLYNNIVVMRRILQRPINTDRINSKIIKSILRDEGEWRLETQKIGLKTAKGVIVNSFERKKIKTFSYTGLSWKFQNWLRTKEGKSENTAKQYAYSVRQTQRHFFENTTGVYCTDKENQKNIIQNMINAYSFGGQFEDFGSYGHNTRICALRAYLRFLNSIYPDTNSIEENINSQHTNSAAETTKSTPSAICSEKDSRCITKKQSILSKMNKAEYTSHLNLLESKTKTEDSNIVNNVATFLEENSGENHTESFFKAVESNDVQKIQELLQSGIDINAKDKDGWTPLMYAASKKATDIAKILIEAGADLNATDNCGWTALMDAVDRNSIDIVRLLIDAGADLDTKNNSETTAIMLTRGKDADTITKLLKDAGAKIQSLDTQHTINSVKATNGMLNTMSSVDIENKQEQSISMQTAQKKRIDDTSLTKKEEVIESFIAQRTVIHENGYCLFITNMGNHILVDEKGVRNKSLPPIGNNIKINVYKTDEKWSFYNRPTIIDWSWE